MRNLLYIFGIGLIVASVSIASPLSACSRGERGASGVQSPSCRRSFSEYAFSGWSHLISVESNNYNPDCNPWVTADRKKLFFISLDDLNGPSRFGHQGSWDIYMAEWDSVNNRWGEGINLGPNINTDRPERRPSTTPNGDTLFFSRGGNIYVSIWSGFDWTPPVQLFQGSDPAISFDGQTLYFVRNNDIWTAKRGASIFDWHSFQSIGPPVNTSRSEVRPFISADGQKLFFSDFGGSRSGSYGGADIWVSTWTGTGWSEPLNMGPPINTDLPACTPFLMPDGETFYTASESFEGSRGDEDVWVSYLDSIPGPRFVLPEPGIWQKTGELEGAWNVYALIEGADGTLYAGTSPGDRVYKSNDRGTNWSALDPLPGTMIVYSLLCTGDGALYAGTYPHGDVFKSTDGGATWTNTADLSGATAVRVLIEAKDDRILAGTSTPGRIFASADGGASWQLLADIPLNGIFCLYEAEDSSIYAGGWGSPYKSTDGGSSWWPLNNFPFPPNEMRSINSVTETRDGTLWATGWVHAHGGYVFKSTTAGAVWDTTGRIMVGPVHAVRIYDLLEDGDGRLFIGFQPGPDSVVFYSADGGLSWKNTGVLSGAHEVLCLLKTSDGTIYAGTTPNGDIFRRDAHQKGDVNGDGMIDVIDVVRTVHILLGIGPDPTTSELWAADCNGDGITNVLDVVGIVNVILGIGTCLPKAAGLK
ncbi:MAG: dockerin type I domain-containing protein [bacterium]